MEKKVCSKHEVLIDTFGDHDEIKKLYVDRLRHRDRKPDLNEVYRRILCSTAKIDKSIEISLSEEHWID